MINDNRVSAELSAEAKASILQKVTEIKALLPFLVGLPTDARRELLRLGNKTVG